MAINSTDIKLLESERMADTSDGGGRRTSQVIPDGVAGNIFPKVSRLDSVYGRVNLRKVYGAVQTTNLDTYAGTHVVLMDPPDNNKIHVTTFTTSSDFDTRAAARDRIESYVIAGPKSRFWLYGRQLVGQSAITIFLRTTDSLPEVGGVICLSKETTVGQTTTTDYQQFVRIVALEFEVRTFNDGGPDFERRVCTLTLSTTLLYEFEGVEQPRRDDTLMVPKAFIRTTTLADAARYFGVRPTTLQANQNDLTVKVDTVYSPLVPTTQRETPLSNVPPQGVAVQVPGATTTQILEYIGEYYLWDVKRTIYTRQLFQRGGLEIVISASGFPTVARDDGTGRIVSIGAIVNGTLCDPAGTVIGTCDYSTGRVTINYNVTGPYSPLYWYAKFFAAPEVALPAHTKEIDITIANRGTVYVETLNPLPDPGTLIVDFRALGKWYRLRDLGNGELSADDVTIGIGTINYATGALVITLGALPDTDTSIVISWGSKIHFAPTTDDAGSTARVNFTLTNLPVKRGSLSIAYTAGTTTYTATATTLGVISGGGVSGTVNCTTGEVVLEFATRLPNSGTNIVATYNQNIPSQPGDEIFVSGTIPTIGTQTLQHAPILPGSFRMVLNSPGWSSGATVTVIDDGNGVLTIPAQKFSQTTTTIPINIGTINYTTGQVVFTTTSFNYTFPSYSYYTNTWGTGSGTATFGSATPVTYVAEVDGVPAVESAKTENYSLDDHPITVDLTRTVARAVVPGSIHFTLANKQYFDRNGTLYTDYNRITQAATAAGSVDYSNGLCEVTFFTGNTALGLSVQSCATAYGDFTTTDIIFRTAGAPVRIGSFYVQVTALDGELLTATANDQGVISGNKITGEFLTEIGVARLQFGETVNNNWVPAEVLPSTLAYNAVVLSNLPLNADILGLDPVRLPTDGRVPIYRPADVVVIHNTQSLTLPNPVAAGSTHSVGRTNLAEIYLLDANNVRVPTDKYTVNLASGVITMAAVLDLTGYAQPLVAKHRIEEMNLLSDVQITGQLSLTGALSRQYPVGSYVSSALLFGDLNARVTNVFDQSTWTNVWQNTLIGTGATAQYNDIDYPIEVLNNGAVTERWRINFTSATAFQVIGENLGVIATGTTSVDLQPVNTLTGLPYFTLRAAGWGLGWSAGNQLRFNTLGATAPMWIARTILPGATLNGDSFDLQLRGDVDA